MVLHCFFQLHVSALAMSHLQVDHFLLCKANHTISNGSSWEKSDQPEDGFTEAMPLCDKYDYIQMYVIHNNNKTHNIKCYKLVVHGYMFRLSSSGQLKGT